MIFCSTIIHLQHSFQAIFKQKAEQIRQKAEHIYNKYKVIVTCKKEFKYNYLNISFAIYLPKFKNVQAMFNIPEGQSFWQSFSNQVMHFKELTKDMSEEKVFSLMSDPACSGSFIAI